MSLVSKLLLAVTWLFAAVALVVTLFHKITWLTYLYYFSYIKIGVTLIKYIPQVNTLYLPMITSFDSLPAFHSLSTVRPSVRPFFHPSIHSSIHPSVHPSPPSFLPSFLRSLPPHPPYIRGFRVPAAHPHPKINGGPLPPPPPGHYFKFPRRSLKSFDCTQNFYLF